VKGTGKIRWPCKTPNSVILKNSSAGAQYLNTIWYFGVIFCFHFMDILNYPNSISSSATLPAQMPVSSANL
jgi:hypothetical protein